MMYETMYYEGVEGCNEGIGECRKSTGPAKRENVKIMNCSFKMFNGFNNYVWRELNYLVAN